MASLISFEATSFLWVMQTKFLHSHPSLLSHCQHQNIQSTRKLCWYCFRNISPLSTVVWAAIRFYLAHSNHLLTCLPASSPAHYDLFLIEAPERSVSPLLTTLQWFSNSLGVNAEILTVIWVSYLTSCSTALHPSPTPHQPHGLLNIFGHPGLAPLPRTVFSKTLAYMICAYIWYVSPSLSFKPLIKFHLLSKT